MKLDFKFKQSNQNFILNFSEDAKSFKSFFGEIHTVTEYVGGNPYNGEYAVTPKVESQTLLTKEKVMLDDMTILAIPYFETSNNSGGNTVYIGNEV